MTTLLEINPLSKPVAIFEMLVLIAIVFAIGWVIAWWIANEKANRLRQALSAQEDELGSCHQARESFTMPSQPAIHRINRDDLKAIEGIGPKIEALLHSHGILTFSDLAGTAPARLAEILRVAGPNLQFHDPTSWPQQSSLARDGRWEELHDLQAHLDGGRVV